MNDWKDKYIALKRAVSDLRRGNMTHECLELIFGWDTQEFNTVFEYTAAYAFDRKDRAEFIKRLNKEKIDLSDLYWFKKDLDTVRDKLMKIDENHPDYKWLSALEALLSNYIFGVYGGSASLEFLLQTT